MTTIESEPDTTADAVEPELVEPAGDSLSLTPVVDVAGSTDHKVIGRLYLVGGLIGLLSAIVVNVLIAVERLDGDSFTLDVEVLPQ